MEGHSCVTTRGHTTLLVMFMLFFCSMCDWKGFFLGPILLVFTLPAIATPISKRETLLCWRLTGAILSLLNVSCCTGPLLYLLLLHDQNKLNSEMGRLLSCLIGFLETVFAELYMPLASPMFGCNSCEFLQKGLEEFSSNCAHFMEMLANSVEVNAHYIRPPGVSRTPIVVDEELDAFDESLMRVYTKLANFTRYTSLAIVTAVMVLFIGATALLAGSFMYLVFSMDDDKIEISSTGGIRHKDGVYRFRTLIFGYEVARGIGVSHHGVLHVPYHVSNGNRVRVGKSVNLPTYMDRASDLVTYGGPPVISSYQDGMTVYANSETDEARTSYIVKVGRDDDMTLYWAGKTKPGESGSPLYGLDAEEQIHLLGLCGRYVQPGPDKQVEFSPIVERMGDSGVEQIVTHPGSGKTHIILPKVIARLVPTLSGKKILVSGPTRVVCLELAQALKTKYSVGVNVSTVPGRDPSAMIQVAAHASALRMLVNEAREVRNLGLIIIDEAHVKDPATIMLREFARGNHIRLVEMSATLDGVNDSGSNYPIEDVRIKAHDVDRVLDEELGNGRRVMIFVPGVRNQGTEAMYHRFQRYRPVLLSRNTMVQAMRAVHEKDGEAYSHRLIISTDIAECGINIPDLDVVVDTMKKYTHVREGNLIRGKMVIPGKASVTQRRGRVGRIKSGKYYYTDEPSEEEEETAAEFDAKVMMTGRSWSRVQTNEWGLRATDYQFDQWLKGEDSPLWVIMSTTSLGLRKTDTELELTLQDYRDGESLYMGCGVKACPCVGEYRFYDERNHRNMYVTTTTLMY